MEHKQLNLPHNLQHEKMSPELWDIHLPVFGLQFVPEILSALYHNPPITDNLEKEKTTNPR